MSDSRRPEDDDVTKSEVDKPLLASPAHEEDDSKRSASAQQKLVLFGIVDMTDWSENAQAAVLAGGALLSSLGFAYLQEKCVLVFSLSSSFVVVQSGRPPVVPLNVSMPWCFEYI